jgi:phosphoribosylanthranilate isomerase
MTRIKVCGLTRREDAELAVELGAHAIGLVFWSGSPRAVAPRVAREITRALPPFVVRVGVFVDASAEEVTSLVESVGLDAIQLHGDERVEEFARVPARIIKSIAFDDDASFERAAGLPSHVTVLVDAADRVKRGGTGVSADWQRAASLSAERPIILAGGLTAANVSTAIQAVRPWAVDVSSGVESAPGVKSDERLRAFFAAARGVEAT